MTIAITGASGALGRHTAELLLTTVDPRRVVLTTRTPAGLAHLAERGADVRHADFTDPGTLTTAFAGVERLLIVSTDTIGARLDPQRRAIAAAAAAGVRHVVYTSVPEPVPANPALVVDDHAATEQALVESGLAWTVLRNNLYAHMSVPGLAHAAEAGRFVTNSGEGATAYVTREDCAAVAAAVLTQDGHEGLAYDVTGPEALTAADLVALASEVWGRSIELVDVDDATRVAGLRAIGLPDSAAKLVASFGASTRGGYLARVSSTVADLTGAAPTSLGALARAALVDTP